MAQVQVELASQEEIVGICGHNDEFVRLIGKSFAVRIVPRGVGLFISGEDSGEVSRVEALFRELYFLYKQGNTVTEQDVRYGIKIMREDNKSDLHSMYADSVLTTLRGRQVRAKTLCQQRYVDCIRNNFITLGIGPAGTGKTYLAVAMAVAALKNRLSERIVLTRPVVEAGEKLGFLPGDLQEKVDPYLRPLYDGMYDMLGYDTFQKYLSKGIIEVAPLAYMRGRTINDSFVILDEAQNTTPEQMKMFLTRFGFGSKMVITGDVTQVDLPVGKFSGLKEVAQILQGVSGIGICHFSDEDVVRHDVVGAIIQAYERFDKKTKDRV